MSLKTQIESKLHLPVRLRVGAPGSLTVLVDGEPIYSKKQAHRPPNTDEILRVIGEKAARA